MNWNSSLELSGNIGLRCTRLEHALLLARDDSFFLQIVSYVTDTTHELSVITCYLTGSLPRLETRHSKLLGCFYFRRCHLSRTILDCDLGHFP